jgi:hypothetical protein
MEPLIQYKFLTSSHAPTCRCLIVSVLRANVTEASAIVAELVTRVQCDSGMQWKGGVVELPTEAVKFVKCYKDDFSHSVI